ncbi:ribbon-helix-helix domain-containing protein [Enterobacter roggenkampii]|nr:ribbon-helix-helix domain-containing protein [Enterobacter roggenkampii]
MGAASAAALNLHGGITTALWQRSCRHTDCAIEVNYNMYYSIKNTNCSYSNSEIKPMPDLKEILKNSLFNQVDDSVSAPISIRLPTILNNELDELSLSLDRSKSSLISEFIKAGVAAANELLKEHSLISDELKEQLVDQREDSAASFMDRKAFMLNTNYNNDEETHFDMLKNQEAAAFCKGWKEYICQLSKGDKVYLYQSGVGIIASGVVDGDLVKSEHYGVADDKYAKPLKDFKTGFKAISARRFKELTGGGANFRRTMIELTSMQAHAIAQEIEKLTAKQ